MGDHRAAARAQLWSLIHAERAALADDLAGLDQEQWATPSLCGRWSVEEVVAHLTAAASLGRFRWLLSVVGARGDFDVHNDRRLTEQRGASPTETLQRFRAVVDSSTAASGHTAAWLGEVVVHGQDVRRALGLAGSASVEAMTEVARFFVSRDFTVPSKTLAAGLQLEAMDGPFRHGEGPPVSGTSEALTMTLAGRSAYLGELSGPGVTLLRDRIDSGDK
ncbi:MAG: maleylpyruvate isomerase family mycothiol-dependent enzyme [Pseudonocardia sp.]|nr:maleylpyruvate isomerase family mycothiol-dependent enzyme [Pseudonocardia sp.]